MLVGQSELQHGLLHLIQVHLESSEQSALVICVVKLGFFENDDYFTAYPYPIASEGFPTP